MNIDEILKKVPEKLDFGWTTSRKFKRDVYDFFNTDEFINKSCLEIGSAHGHTTVILCSLFSQVYGINLDSTEEAEKNCNLFGKENVTFYVRDVYSDGLPNVDVDVIFVDAVHTYDAVLMDVSNSLRLKSNGKKYFIFDDVGLVPDVYKAIKDLCDRNVIRLIKNIGHVPGDIFKRPLNYSEGVICVEL